MQNVSKLIFVGEAPGPSGRVGLDGHSGKRLAALLDVKEDVLRRATFLNLLRRWPGPSWRHHERGGKGSRFPVAKARRRVPQLLHEIHESSPAWRKKTIVVLGRRVATALDVHDIPFMTPRTQGIMCWGIWLPIVVVPHPSGVNRLWNDVDVILKFREVLKEVAR